MNGQGVSLKSQDLFESTKKDTKIILFFLHTLIHFPGKMIEENNKKKEGKRKLIKQP